MPSRRVRPARATPGPPDPWPVTAPAVGLGAPWPAPQLDDGAVVHDVTIEGADLSGCVAGELDLARTTFRACSLVGARLAAPDLVDVAFEGCDLSGAIVTGGRFTRVSVSGGRARGWVLDGVALTDVALVGVRAPGLVLVGSTVRRFGVRACDLTEAELRGTTITEATFEDADLRGVDLVRADVAARFVRTHLHGVAGVASLRGSTLDPAALADLAEAMAAHLGIGRIVEAAGDAAGGAGRHAGGGGPVVG